ncbi:hypothetical protein ROU88_07760 [Macrococcus capreoli]|uniref:hypothetical protein n=1 Tax=Macrococcus capreoli TaxID=2982690 RepID=UPI0021D5DFB7|nr:hypothetical protein [Macrococcus sp. TMW 2.2395]MCU7556177.1 hypothetical protein [Macrococcus sp. TMW 2.2395]
MIKKGLTRRKMLKNFFVYCSVLVLSTYYIKYFNDPENAYNLDSYLPMLIGAITAFVVIYFNSKKEYPGDLDTKLTDERDEMIANKYNSLALPFLLFYIPSIFLLISIPLKIKTVSVGDLSIVLLLMMAAYSIGHWFYKNAKS